MKPGNRLRLLVFLLIGGLAVVHVSARYAGLTDALLGTTYRVNVDLAESGGLFPRGEVTYRGFTVGRVRDLDFDTDGVTAVLAIDDKWKIPANLVAEVHNRSAVGEQYIDLVPRADGAPYLRDGSVVSTANTTTPTDEQELIVAADELFRSVPTSDLQTVIDESVAAFSGAGSDLGRVIDNSDVILKAADRSLPETIALLRNGGTVLKTQDGQADLIADYVADLADLSGVVAGGDERIGRILVDGTRAARELRVLATELAPALPVLLANVLGLSAILDSRVTGLEEALVTIPWALASALTPGRDARAHFTFVGGTDPAPCHEGYIPADLWQSSNSFTPSRLSADIGCRTRTSVPRGVVGAPGKLAYGPK